MACKERSEHECKSYPKCDGCNAYTKDLTFKHRFPHKAYKDGEWDTVADSTASCRVHDNGEKEIYSMGPVVDRLHEFEKLGYEPEELNKITKTWRMYRLMAHSTFGKMGTYQDTDSLSSKRDDAVDTLYYLAKLAGDVENAQCDDISSMYPSMMYTKDGFREMYVTNDKFKKIMDERIRDAILRPVTKQKIWVTTSSSIKDDEFIKKVKETMKSFNLDKGSKLTQLYVPEDWEPVEGYVKFDVDYTRNMVATIRDIKTDKEKKDMIKIDRVIFNNPATIVFWADGDKTVVKAQNGEPYDPEKGLAMAISKKALGNGNKWYNEFKKQLENCDAGFHMHSAAWCGYNRLVNALHDKKATKADLVIAMEEAIGYFGEEIQ